MIKVAIVDDSIKCIEQLKALLTKYQSNNNVLFDIHTYVNGIAFLDKYSCDFDIVFMDMEMPHIDGLSVCKELRKNDQNVKIVFVTIMEQLAIKGYEVDATYYLIKPLEYKDFANKMQKIIQKIECKHTKNIILQKDGQIKNVCIDDIMLIESDNHWCIFTLKDSEMYKKLISLKKVEEYVGKDFLRAGNSFLINPIYVLGWNNTSVTVGKRNIPISRSKKKELLDNLTRWFGENDE